MARNTILSRLVEDLNKQEEVARKQGCPPSCTIDDSKWDTKVNPNCTCHGPFFIAIPAGKHFHPCKVHPQFVIRGQDIRC